MPETFECPECGKQYARENRLVGKAVACECGHRFLVPPREPPAAPLTGAPIRPAPRPISDSTPGGEGAVRAGLPARGAPTAQPAARKPSRWSDPAPPSEPVPLTEADLIDESPQRPLATPATPLPHPAVPVQTPAHAIGFPPPASPALPPNPYKPPEPKKRKKPKGQSSQDSAAMIGRWAAALVSIVFLPAAGFCGVMAIYRHSQYGWLGEPAPAPASAATAPSAAAEAPSVPSHLPQTTPNDEPGPGGKLVTIWNGKKISRGGLLEFSLEYRLDGLSSSPETKYYWVVVDRADSKVEFPIPADLLKPRDRLSGQPKGISEAQFPAPYKTHLERQSPGMSQRETISNEIQISGS